MIRTVDLVVIVDDGFDDRVVDGVARGLGVLVVMRSGGARASRRFRRTLRKAGGTAATGQVSVVSDADVVCVAGVGGVEAVVYRYRRTGRLGAVNASAVLVHRRAVNAAAATRPAVAGRSSRPAGAADHDGRQWPGQHEDE